MNGPKFRLPSLVNFCYDDKNTRDFREGYQSLMRTSSIRHTLYGGLIALSLFSVTACGSIPSHHVAPATHISKTKHDDKNNPPATKPIRILTTLQPEVRDTFSGLEWTALIPAMTSDTGRIPWNQQTLTLTADSQPITYVVYGNLVYWIAGDRLSLSTITLENGKIVVSTNPLFQQHGLKLWLWTYQETVYVSAMNLTTSTWQLYALQGQQTLIPLMTMKTNKRPAIFAITWNRYLYMAIVPSGADHRIKIIALQDSKIKQIINLPIWPVQLEVNNGLLHLNSGPFTYVIDSNDKLTRSKSASTNLLHLFSALEQGFQANNLYLPAPIIKGQNSSPMTISCQLLSPSSYTMDLSFHSNPPTAHVLVQTTSKNPDAAAYESWISRIHTLSGGISGKPYLSNTPITTPTTLSDFWCHYPILHQFILTIPQVAWVKWEQANSSQPNWYASWGNNGWIYTLGPLTNPNDPVSLALLKQQIELSKHTDFNSYSSNGSLALKINWRQSLPHIVASEYSFTPVANLHVTLTTKGYSGWKDLAMYQVVENSST